jgi:hypothetical protein
MLRPAHLPHSLNAACQSPLYFSTSRFVGALYEDADAEAGINISAPSTPMSNIFTEYLLLMFTLPCVLGGLPYLLIRGRAQ